MLVQYGQTLYAGWFAQLLKMDALGQMPMAWGRDYLNKAIPISPSRSSAPCVEILEGPLLAHVNTVINHMQSKWTTQRGKLLTATLKAWVSAGKIELDDEQWRDSAATADGKIELGVSCNDNPGMKGKELSVSSSKGLEVITDSCSDCSCWWDNEQLVKMLANESVHAYWDGHWLDWRGRVSYEEEYDSSLAEDEAAIALGYPPTATYYPPSAKPIRQEQYFPVGGWPWPRKPSR